MKLQIKKIMLLLIGFTAVTAAEIKCQPFPKISDQPIWKVGVRSFWAGTCEALQWKFGDSTVICGVKYIEALECDHNGNNCVVKGYIRVDSERVYVRKTVLCAENDQLMYNFALAQNAAYTMGYNIGTYDTTAARVTATQTLAYMGLNRLTQSITYTVDPPANNYSDAFFAIRGIGSDVHPFFPLICFGDFCETDIQLLEYREHNLVLYSKQPVFPAPCNSWVGIVENNRRAPVLISPNPASQVLKITSGEMIKHVILLDCLGKVCFDAVPLSNEFFIDLSGLTNGFYTVQILFKDENKTLTCQKVLKAD